MDKKPMKIKVNIMGEDKELTAKDIESLRKNLSDAQIELERQEEENEFQEIIDGGLDSVIDYITKETRNAECMDYYTNGGCSYEVIELIHYLPTDMIKALGDRFNGDYLEAANKELEARGEEKIGGHRI